MNKSKAIFSISLFLFFLQSCTVPEEETFINSPTDGTISEESINTVKTAPILVKTVIIKNKNFSLQSFSTGKLVASEKVELKLPTSGIIDELSILEGQTIEEGELICQMDVSDLQYQMQQKNAELDEAKFQKKDLLVKWGGDHNNDQSVPAEILENIHIQTGINLIKKQMEYIRYQMGLASLYAPFSGIISDIKTKRFQRGTIGESICVLINPNSFEASFDILEKDAVQLRKGQLVKVKPVALANKTINANITTINPFVNQEGLVNVKAKINGNHSKLMEGMNVEVSIEKSVGKYIIVPKVALVIRSNREVVFSYEPSSGLAQWNYVTIAHENEDYYAISKGLKQGMEIIVENNNNLDHDAKVEIDTLSKHRN